ncbi:MAG: glycosyltransferase [Anaerolineales bacterium]|nr:glycosyltransferase [Anaerolineales bacterium]
MNQPLISIVLVAWNSAAYIPRCFQHLLAQTVQDFEVIVVDNGSKDDGCADLQENIQPLPCAWNGSKSIAAFPLPITLVRSLPPVNG